MGNFRRLMRHNLGRIGFLTVFGLVALALLAPLVQSAESLRQDLSSSFQGPSAEHWLGTDQVGRDLFARLVGALRTTLWMAGIGTTVALAVGVIVGLTAAYKGGVLEALVLRFLDIVLSVPNLVLALTIAVLMGAGTKAVIVALIVRAFPAFVRVAHSSTQQVLAREFVASAVVLGARPSYVLRSYVLPNILPPAFVLFPVLLGQGVLIAASLSFFGLGVQPPESELGLLVAEGRRFIYLHPSLIWFPGIVLTVMNVGFSWLGSGLRESLDPIHHDRAAV